MKRSKSTVSETTKSTGHARRRCWMYSAALTADSREASLLRDGRGGQLRRQGRARRRERRGQRVGRGIRRGRRSRFRIRHPGRQVAHAAAAAGWSGRRARRRRGDKPGHNACGRRGRRRRRHPGRRRGVVRRVGQRRSPISLRAGRRRRRSGDARRGRFDAGHRGLRGRRPDARPEAQRLRGLRRVGARLAARVLPGRRGAEGVVKGVVKALNLPLHVEANKKLSPT